MSVPTSRLAGKRPRQDMEEEKEDQERVYVEEKQKKKISIIDDKLERDDVSTTVSSEQGVLERKEMELPVGFRALSIGLICHSTPFWFWASSTLGSVVWIDRENVNGWASQGFSMVDHLLLPPRAKHQSRKRSATGKQKHPPPPRDDCWDNVDVVLFDELAPGPAHNVWKGKRIRFVVWWRSRKASGPPRDDPAWSVSKLRMEHAILGGVTTRVDWIFVAVRDSRAEDSTQVAFANWWTGAIEEGLRSTTVKGIVKPTEHGRPKSRHACKEEDLLCNRKMNWNQDIDRLHVLPSVFSPTGLVARRLVGKELALALDFPSDLSSLIEDEQTLMSLLKGGGPPFKTRIQVARLLRDFKHLHHGSVHLDPSAKGRTCNEIHHSDLKGAPGMKGDDEDCLPDDMEVLTHNELFQEERSEDRNLKATKADDAEIPYYLWNDRILEHFELTSERDKARGLHALDWIRHGALRFWKRSVSQSFWKWWKKSKDKLDVKARENSVSSGLSALRHSALASWWDWDEGSSPFFWRMTDPDWLVDMRDGVKPMWIGPPPKYRKAQRPNSDPNHLALEKKKIGKVRRRGYIGPTKGIRSLTSFFSVPKGPTDIRMVYDGTKSGLNDSLLAPWFGLATVDLMLRTVCEGTWSGDNDFGEMFLNFWIHPEIRAYTGVDLTTLFPEELEGEGGEKKFLWEAWTRCAMGVTVSPYQTTQCTQRVKRIVFGCRFSKSNVFRWVEVKLNLPGNEDYDPSKPWICKVREDGQIAVDVHSYVDDLRGTAPTKEEAWQASSAMAKGSAFFGLQDAARKRRPPSQSPGAWAGAVVETTGTEVLKTVSQERWDKTRKHVATLSKWASSDSPINRRDLERIRGFLVYVSLTFKSLVPYLKGIQKGST